MMATAEQTVSAVLESTNKRYLVEHAEAEDGSWGYDLYSDGFIRQGGIVDFPNGEYNMTVTANFPKTISQMINPNAAPYSSHNDGGGITVKSWTETSITVAVADEHNFINKPMQCFWIVEAMI